MIENNFYLNWSFWNLLILLITLIILIWYTIETHRIANQSIETNLRPIILRSGIIESWVSIKFKKIKKIINGSPIPFLVSKNIATSITGFIVINNYKYTLLFGCQISSNGITTSYRKTWGWIKPDNYIYAVFDEKSGIKTTKQNQIIINYKDIEGNNYHTIENKNWDQKSFRGKLS